ncbi:tyrosine-type recombinase/integrase [Vibrio methylphosphonaticus]|uniref:tyrosine-type recombinase/integrase n=1 Tax=Vibrio methylphosphonaticus TaxID=2946866 RepID=UPI00202A97A7|nr:tyrosine-type recombinase/integrase [Vibrio methylphosphonaticus]MCL9774750.1 tyrosine-type recombinase/integrase [Vibrio methylphosphonaticus]
MKHRLTATEVKNAKLPEGFKMIRICDGNGLYLAVGRRSKHWELRIKTLAGKETYLRLGSTNDLTLKEGRLFTVDTHAARAKGIEPKHFVRQRRGKDTPSFQEIMGQWLLIQKKRLKTSTYLDMEKRYRCHILDSSLGCTPIKLVTSKHIYEFLDTFDQKGQIPTLNKLFTMITRVLDYSAMFSYSEPLDLSNMKSLFSLHRSTPHASIEVNGLGELITLVATSKLKLSVKLMFELQLLLGTRCCETVKMKWADICEVNWVWTLPKEICKNGLQHEIPLSSQAITALKLAKQLADDSQYVFPSPHKKTGDKPRCKATLNHAFGNLGLKSQMTGHGTRAISETTMHEQLGAAETLIIEAIHSHTDNNTIRKVYNRKTFFNDRKRILEWWGNQYSDLVGAKTCSYYVQNELTTFL